MKVHELNIKSRSAGKRLGRGIGSGKGKTAGRGTKGQWARSGGGVRPGFEGGQNPWSRRMPKKRGFASLSRIDFQIVNVGDLEQFKAGQTVDAKTLAAAGLVKNASRPVKVLGDGQLTKKLSVVANAASVKAKSTIQAAGGNFKAAAKTKSEGTKREPEPA